MRAVGTLDSEDVTISDLAADSRQLRPGGESLRNLSRAVPDPECEHKP
jgi:hypothetical protein